MSYKTAYIMSQEKKTLGRSNLNAQPHKPCNEPPGCNNFPCSLDIPGSSPTTVSDRVVEKLKRLKTLPGNLNSCKRSAERVIKPLEKDTLQNCSFFSKTFSPSCILLVTFSLP